MSSPRRRAEQFAKRAIGEVIQLAAIVVVEFVAIQLTSTMSEVDQMKPNLIPKFSV